jgi:PIN domain nuclease of toxin-antitoxin system
MAADKSLLGDAERAVADASSEVFVSAASAWEISIKRRLGKLEVPDDLVAQLDRNRFEPLPISVEHAMVAAALAPHHQDPFDRMLIAQAQVEGLTIVTRDPRFRQYRIPILYA